MSELLQLKNADNMLANCWLFSDLEQEDYDHIIRTSSLITLRKNNILFHKGDELNCIYLLVSGSIKLQILSPSGDEKIIDMIHPGQTFAEAVLFAGGHQYPVTAIANLDCEVAAINAKTYLSYLSASNELCLKMLVKLSQRLHWMVNEMDQLTLHNATFRLVHFLLTLSKESTSENQKNITLLVSKKELASRLTIKPETLSRIFKTLTQQRLLELKDNHIKLLNLDKLNEIVDM